MDFRPFSAYLVASMKRLLALAALILGLSALVAPAHARLHYDPRDAEVSRVDRTCTGVEAIRRDAEAAQPRTSRAKRNRELGAPASKAPRTVLLPVIMLADRPLE
ncbi:hypothetical protein [Croceicoccus bisphenolivorans]|uniref:hypothetical protein n=1 Tax=Croceicoccus bisphenolivorans TaxID=1783232 RepID=UPI000AFEC8F2|nr:hypothetical protein [Croceicoccus bisphenolivorans]